MGRYSIILIVGLFCQTLYAQADFDRQLEQVLLHPEASQEILQQLESQSSAEPQNIALAKSLAKFYSRTANHKSAYKIIDRVLNYSMRKGPQTDRDFSLYIWRGSVAFRMGNVIQAFEDYHTAETYLMFLKTEDQEKLINKIVNAYIVTGDLVKAKSYAQAGVRVYQSKNSQFVLNLLNQLEQNNKQDLDRKQPPKLQGFKKAPTEVSKYGVGL